MGPNSARLLNQKYAVSHDTYSLCNGSGSFAPLITQSLVDDGALTTNGPDKFSCVLPQIHQVACWKQSPS